MTLIPKIDLNEIPQNFHYKFYLEFSKYYNFGKDTVIFKILADDDTRYTELDSYLKLRYNLNVGGTIVIDTSK